MRIVGDTAEREVSFVTDCVVIVVFDVRSTTLRPVVESVTGRCRLSRCAGTLEVLTHRDTWLFLSCTHRQAYDTLSAYK